MKILESLIMYWPAAIASVMILALMILLRMYSGRGKLPYAVRERLVTKAELRFYRALQIAIVDDYEVFAMVRIADVLIIPAQTHQRKKWLNKILAKHVDFVLCDPGTLAPRLAIELDDTSHDRPDRQGRDEFVDHAFESAGLPLLRVRVSQSYDPRSIRELINTTVRSG
jgi:hypothetical protein